MVANQNGQSILEVVFVLPFLFLFVGLLYKVNFAVQMAINNTQFARSQLYVLTSNSPEYPRYQVRFQWGLFGIANQDRMVLGVADATALTSANMNDSSIEPIPQSIGIARKKTTVPGSDSPGEVNLRTNVRVRNTAAICTQLNSVGSKTPWNSESVKSLGSQRWPFKQDVCQYQGVDQGAGEAI